MWSSLEILENLNQNQAIFHPDLSKGNSKKKKKSHLVCLRKNLAVYLSTFVPRSGSLDSFRVSPNTSRQRLTYERVKEYSIMYFKKISFTLIAKAANVRWDSTTSKFPSEWRYNFQMYWNLSKCSLHDLKTVILMHFRWHPRLVSLLVSSTFGFDG